jgi:hypothetical protein
MLLYLLLFPRLCADSKEKVDDKKISNQKSALFINHFNGINFLLKLIT